MNAQDLAVNRMARRVGEDQNLVGVSNQETSLRNPILTLDEVITYNLRDPSMFRGKKGFDRLIYACKTVFTQPMTWLFYDNTVQCKHPT